MRRLRLQEIGGGVIQRQLARPCPCLVNRHVVTAADLDLLHRAGTLWPHLENESRNARRHFPHAKSAYIRVEQLDRLLAFRNRQLGDDCVGQFFAHLHPVSK